MRGPDQSDTRFVVQANARDHHARHRAAAFRQPAQPPRLDQVRVRLCTVDVAILLMTVLLTVVRPSKATAENAHLSDCSDMACYGSFVDEASHRFAIPGYWIRAVMLVESAGRLRATSPRGALGLMQIMPKTWSELRKRYGLGFDPFDPHDNIIAGTAYLREMLDRFGLGGFIAAYNVGPGRYRAHLADGQPLPRETQSYVGKLTQLMAAGREQKIAMAAISGSRNAPLFVEIFAGSSARATQAAARRVTGKAGWSATLDGPFVPAALFVRRRGGLNVQCEDRSSDGSC
jgi:soluble lytic murein transglycosylase-like protein